LCYLFFSFDNAKARVYGRGRIGEQRGKGRQSLRKLGKLLGVAALVLCGTALGQSEIILDNFGPTFSTTGTWPSSSSTAGFVGANYQTHEPNGPPPGALVVEFVAMYEPKLGYVQSVESGIAVRNLLACATAMMLERRHQVFLNAVAQGKANPEEAVTWFSRLSAESQREAIRWLCQAGQQAGVMENDVPQAIASSRVSPNVSAATAL
jgi:hypothetical protein